MLQLFTGFQKHPVPDGGCWESDSTLPSVHDATSRSKVLPWPSLGSKYFGEQWTSTVASWFCGKNRGQVGGQQFPGTRGGKEALLCSVVFVGNGPDVNSFVGFRICWEVKDNPKNLGPAPAR